MKRLIVMMLGGAKRVSIARMIAEACERRGIEPVMASYELREDEPIATVAKVVKGLKWNDPGVSDHIIEALRSMGTPEDSYAVIPFVDGSIEIAARLSQENDWIYSPTSDTEKSKALFDKVESATLFEQHGLPVPPTIDDIDPIYPLIAKPRKGSASKGIKIVRSEADLPKENGSDYLLQELIEPADEYTADCFISQEGEILAISPRKRIDIAGGEVTRSVTIDYPKLKTLSSTVITRLGLKGAVTIQWIERRGSGDPLLMEINPRLGGGAVCSVHAGADLPGFIVDEATGKKPLPTAEIQPNVEIARYFQEVVFKYIPQ
ncbi:MAG: ATP-grasp domain-containing protein [Paramuribaculum sp.]|nr:ATP-grasp domain-containing protein [Paramuribaculum sp.]